MKAIRGFLVLSVSLLMSLKAFGADAEGQNETTAQITVPISKSDVTAERRWGLTLNLSTEANLRETSDYEFNSVSALYVQPSYQVGSKLSLDVRVRVERQNSGAEEVRLQNTRVNLARSPISLGDSTNLSLAVRGFLPTDQELRREKSFQGAVGMVSSLSHSLTLMSRPLSIYVGSQGIKNNHRFERDSLDVANISYTVRGLFGLSFKASQRFSINLDNFYQYGETYQGADRQNFFLS